MKLLSMCIIALPALLAAPASAQTAWKQTPHGQLILRPLVNAPYPHPSREKGFEKFPREPHYTDSTVGIFIPSGFSPGDEVDLVVHFHGHTNNVAKALEQYDLPRQMSEAKVNAVLVVPQGPKDAADSGGGKLELDEGAFAQLIGEVMRFLKQEKKITSAKVGRIALSAHSGGYQVASAVLFHGGLGRQISDVLLLDAAYGSLSPFANWARQDPDRRLISIYTEHLADENQQLMQMLERFGVRYQSLDQVSLTDAQLTDRQCSFIATTARHDDIPAQFLARLLRTSNLAKLKSD